MSHTELDFVFKPGADFRSGMVAYIRRHFSGLLGEDVALLEQPGGLEAILTKYRPS